MGESELRWSLRQLPRELDLPRDLWPGIARRIAPRRRRIWPWLAATAMAASLVLAVALVERAPAPSAGGALAREADALTREYQAALDEFSGMPLPPPLLAEFDALDHGADQIRLALSDDPEAVYLLEQLRRTYARRLALTQRAALG